MSMLSLTDLIRRKESSPREDTGFDRDGTFEHDIEAALELDVDDQFLAQETPEDDDPQPDFEDAAPEESPALPEDEEPQTDVLTPHAQAVMAAFSVFEEANTATREELARIGKAFTGIVTNYNLGREFVERGRQEIQRASDLEHANQRLSAENRRLLERTEKQENTRARLEDLLESSKRREARLIQDCDALRMNVSDLRLEVIEARNANAAAEHARTEMHMALAARTADVERVTREVEALREKLAAVNAELDASQRRQAEARLKLEELHALHAAEVNRYAELNGRAAAGDKEILRLQKQCDATEAQLKETNLALQTAEHDIWERDRRHQSELQSLRSEIEQLSGRLRKFAGEPGDAYPGEDEASDDVVPVIPLRSRTKGRSANRADDEAA